MSDVVRKKRLHAEIENFTADFDTDGIAYIHDGDEGYGLIRGMEDTPYEGGFYVIKFRFGDKYPFAPPACSHVSMSGMRQSPNFHDKKGDSKEGVVCLSRLNTWDSDEGDNWTARLGIAYVLTMIRTQVLTKVPLDREPNYRHSIDNPTNARNYEYFVTYHNYRSNVVNIFQRLSQGSTLIPTHIEGKLAEKIFNYVEKNRQEYIRRLICLSSVHHGRCYNCTTYNNSSCFCDYEELIADFEAYFGTVDKIKIRVKEKVD